VKNQILAEVGTRRTS